MAASRSLAFVVVSGLPASGKTTLARELAVRLGWPHLDKDAMLESLFEADDAPDLDRRRALSREADVAFEAAAVEKGTAVLSSWWRHPLSGSPSGTPIAWLRERDAALVEIRCLCPPAEAVRRFLERRRHAGHADALRTEAGLLAQCDDASTLGPLFPGAAIACDTSMPVSPQALDELAERVRGRLAPS